MTVSTTRFHAPPARRPSVARRYLVAVSATLAGLAFTWALGPWDGREVLFAPLLAAVTVSAWYGGLFPGLAAIVVAVAGSELLLAPFGVRSPGMVRIVVFTGIALLISSLTAARRRAQEALRESEERYALAQRAAGIGTWDWDLLAKRIVWSPETEKVFGVAPHSFAGTYDAFVGFVHPDHRARVAEILERSLAQGDECEVECPIVRQDGTMRWMSLAGDVIRRPDGRPARMLGVVQDVTERRTGEDERRRLLEAEQAARARAEASERRLLLLGEVSQRLLSTLDYRVTLSRVLEALVPNLADGCIVYLQEAEAVRRVTYRHVDPAKQDLLRLMDERYPLDLSADSPPARAIRTGQPVMAHDDPSAAWRGVAKDSGHLRILEALSPSSYMAVPLATRGRVFGAMFLVVTQSGRRYGQDDLAFAGHLARRAAIAIENARLYGEAERARHEAEAANESKDEFLATVSHELRTPLNAILGWAVLLRKGRLAPDAAGRAVESIERNARAQSQLIDDLLDVARITSGQMRLDARPLELAPIVEAAIDAVHPSADAKRIAIGAELDPAAAPVSGDPDRLQQVVWNLLSNAIKFSEPGSAVRVRLTREGDEAVLVVSDTGQGIAAEHIPHIFNRFRKGNNDSYSRRHGGLGLGLAIVRHLVELHGGRIGVESPGPDLGATFSVALPLQQTGEPTGDPRDLAGGRDRSLGRPALEGVRALVVDDEAEAREVLASLLEHAGVRVVVAGSVADALRAFDRERPDIVLSDVAMPGQDGFDLAAELDRRERGTTSPVPRVAITARTRPEDRARLLAVGFDRYLAKPVDPDGLLAVVAELAIHPIERG